MKKRGSVCERDLTIRVFLGLFLIALASSGDRGPPGWLRVLVRAGKKKARYLRAVSGLGLAR